jgi:hypothetical protein
MEGIRQNKAIERGDTYMSFIEKIKNKSVFIGVIGLGYVGLPLAVEKAKA